MRAAAQRGSTLIEVIIATAIVGIALTTIVSTTVLVIRNQRQSADQQTADALTQEAAEWVRKQRDVLGWPTFFDMVTADNNNLARYCLGSSLPDIDPASGDFQSLSHVGSGSSCSTITDNDAIFTRYIELDNVTSGGTEQIEATIITEWDDGDLTRSAISTLHLFEWDR